MPAPSPSLPAIAPSSLGGYSKDDFLKDVKSGALSVPKLADKNTTKFTWSPESTQFWDKAETVPSLGDREMVAKDMSPIKVQSGVGASLMKHPIQVKEAVKLLVSQKDNSTVESLTPRAKAAYLKRRTAMDKQGPIRKTLNVMADLGQEVMAPVGRLIEQDYAQNRGEQTLAEVEGALTQKINSLMKEAQQESLGGLATGKAAAKYALARETFDAMMEAKINHMNDKELMDFDTDHPVMQNITSSLAVGSTQFILLRNAPFLKQLGDSMQASTLMKASKFMGPAAKMSKTTKGLVSLTAEVAGELPASFVMPVMNFDFERRPLNELPAQVLTDLALIIPTALVGHGAMRATSAVAAPVVSALTKAVIKSSTKVAAMMRALKLPMKEGVDKSFEQAVMGESDNAFSRILDAFPEERMALRSFFEQQRFSAEGENRMLSLSQSPDVSMGESRLIGKTGPKQKIESVQNKAGSEMLDVASNRTTRGEKVRTQQVLSELETKLEFERMVGEVRAFRDGSAQGTSMTKQVIKETQTRMQDFIEESLPMKYRGRALSLLKSATNPQKLVAAVDKIEKIVRDVDLAELKLGKTRGAIKRQARSAMMRMLETPDISTVEPFKNNVWMRKLVRTFGLDDEAIDTFLTKAHIASYDQFAPVKNLRKTWTMMKQFVKVVEAEQGTYKKMADEIFVGNFDSPKAVNDFNRYAYLKAFRENALQGNGNGFSKDLNIPNNPSVEWLDAEIAKMSTPDLERANAQKNKFFQNALDDLVEAGNVDPATAAEWKAKGPNFVSFYYEKFLQASDGNPGNSKSWNFKETGRTKGRTSGSGLEVSPNLYNTMRKYANEAVKNKWMNRIAKTMREEMGVKPLQIIEGPTAKRVYQAVGTDNQLVRFDKTDLDAELVKGLEGQRVLFSQFDGQAFLVPKDIAEMVQGLKGGTLDPISQQTAKLSRAWSYLTTTVRGSFLIANPLRDYQSGLRYTKHGMVDFTKSYVRSAMDVFAGMINSQKVHKEILMSMDDDMARASIGKFQASLDTLTKVMAGDGWEKRLAAFRQGGGTQGTFVSELRTNLKGVEEFQLGTVDPKFKQGWMNNPVVRLANGAVFARFETAASLGQALEEIARKAEFDLTMKQTGGDILAAGADSADVTLDFRSKGASPVVKVVQANMPYSYTAFKGFVRKMNLLTGGQKAYVKGAGNVTRDLTAPEIFSRLIAPIIPLGVTSYAINKMTGASNYVTGYLRDNYIPIHTGYTYEDEYGGVNPIFFTIRMDEISASMMNLTYAALDTFVDKNPEAWNNFKNAEFSVLNPKKFAISKLPPWLRLPFEVGKANFSNFRQEAIDKPGLEKKPMELRKFESTTPVGEALGEVLGIGGNQGDYMLQELAPAVFDDIKLIMRSRGGKPDWMIFGEYLKVLQTPNAYFSDAALDMERSELQKELLAGYRDPNVTDEDIVKFETRIENQIKAIDDILDYREAVKEGKPLEGKTIKFQEPKEEVDMDRVWEFLATPPGDLKKAVYGTMSEQEKAEARAIIQKKKAKK